MLRVEYQHQCSNCDSRVLYTHELLKKGMCSNCGTILTPAQYQEIRDGIEKMKNELEERIKFLRADFRFKGQRWEKG
jgi:transcription initiation factor IIE alpha subunit